jgi:glycosyltransferase involved in cell wall biosynthesis
MNILIFSKRQYTGKDLLDDEFGRLYEIPSVLSERQNRVIVFVLSYRRRLQGKVVKDGAPFMDWYSFNVCSLFFGIYFFKLKEAIKNNKPDVVWASSDILHCLIGFAVARLLKVPIVIDLYDNYESFSASKLPLLKFLFRRICRKVDAITVVSRSLRNMMVGRMEGNIPVYIIPNAVRKDVFFKRNRDCCREKLGLPTDAIIIGTAGAISEDRGIQDLFKAFQHLEQRNIRICLAYAGPSKNERIRLTGANVFDFGVLPIEEVGVLVSALDVAIVCNKENDFGSFCFPLKLMEFVSAEVPFVSAAVGDMRSLLSQRADCLYEPGSWKDLSEKIFNKLKTPDACGLPASPSWEDSAILLEKTLQKVIT